MAKKIRIIVNGVSFYTTKKQIAEGVGDNARLNSICLHAYLKCVKEKLAGIGSTFYGESSDTKYDLQINL
jgi:hypothetical protein